LSPAKSNWVSQTVSMWPPEHAGDTSNTKRAPIQSALRMCTRIFHPQPTSTPSKRSGAL